MGRMDAFYEQIDDGRFASTSWTAGPWGPDSQHAGPPSALLTRAIERHQPHDGQRLGRVSVDILGPVPVTDLQIAVRTLRPGRKVELVEATATAGDRVVLVARAWRLRPTPETVPAAHAWHDPEYLPAAQNAVFPGGHMDGYMSAIEWRFAGGAFERFGPASCWGRQKLPLLAGEEPTSWQRVVTLADSGSGISMALDPTRYPALNSDLQVVLHRDLADGWIRMDATTQITPGGGAMATSTLHDRRGPIGTSAQTLLVSDSPVG